MQKQKLSESQDHSIPENTHVADEESPLQNNSTSEHIHEQAVRPAKGHGLMLALIIALGIVIVAMYWRIAQHLIHPIQCPPQVYIQRTKQVLVKSSPQKVIEPTKQLQQLPDWSKSYRQAFLNATPENLWNFSNKDKQDMLKEIQKVYPKLILPSVSSHAGTLPGKDTETALFFKDFEVHAEMVAWHKAPFPPHQIQSYRGLYNNWLKGRNEHYRRQLSEYEQRYSHPHGYISADLGITHYQYRLALELHSLTGQDHTQQKYASLQQKQWQYLDDKYEIGKYAEKELPVCVIIPTFRNEARHRFVWNIESVLMQNYSNYKVVIIDDSSPDQTTKTIARHLAYRKADPNKYHLIRSKRRNRSLIPFYYGAHKYCGYGEILLVIDGDDQLVGRQVFKLLNAVYQKEKVYTLYSNFMWWYGDGSAEGTIPGNSMEYLNNTLLTENYRFSDQHGYNHLRTMLSDLFLLTPNSSLTNKSGYFYEIITDNAVYFPALEMSCGRVRYLPEMLYWYSYNLTSNVVRSNKKDKYREVKIQIDHKPKHECLETTLQRALAVTEIGKYKAQREQQNA